MARRFRRRVEKTGAIALWKPVGLTSRAAINIAQKQLGLDGLGHTGTLDPLASGVLLAVGGEARKFQDLLMQQSKRYIARIWLGLRSVSEDNEGPVFGSWPRALVPEEINWDDLLSEFCGVIAQRPPQHSAVRIDGKRAHERARGGETLEMPLRSVTIYSLSGELVHPSLLELSVHCSSGTYIRSLARDIGKKLGCGAYLCGLIRTHAGGRDLSHCVRPEQAGIQEWQSLEQVLNPLPKVFFDSSEIRRLSQGQFVSGQSQDRLFIEESAVAWERGCSEGAELTTGTVRGIVERGIHSNGDSEIRPKRWLKRST